MATQSVVIDRQSGTPDEKLANWRAWHLYYHACEDHLLLELVRPLAVELLRRQTIDRFFFIRYAYGGPHIRLRWRLTKVSGAMEAEQTLTARAARYFATWPSREPWPLEKIRRINRSLVGIDPAIRPEDDEAYPDNSWHSFPAQFEIERYGGMELLQPSLDLFNLSSTSTLGLLHQNTGTAPGWKLSTMLRLTLHLAWGLAAGEGEFTELTAYAARFMGDDFAASASQADQVFLRKRVSFMETAVRELERLADDRAIHADELFAGCARLGTQLDGLKAEKRWYLAASHIHMTANRLGIANAEEVYLSRMLWQTVKAIQEEAPDLWQRVWRSRQNSIEQWRQDSVHEMAVHAMQTFVSGS